MKNYLIELMNSDDEYAIQQEAEEYYWHSIQSESIPLPPLATPTDWQVSTSEEAPF